MAVSIVSTIRAETITQAPAVAIVIESGSGFVLVVGDTTFGRASEKVTGSTPLNTKPIKELSVSDPFPLVPTAVVSVDAGCFL